MNRWNKVGSLVRGSWVQKSGLIIFFAFLSMAFFLNADAATTMPKIAAGDGHTVAIKSDGTLWAWGLNNYGQLGDGTTTDSNIPEQEATHGANWVSVAAGYSHTVALKSDGTLWAWGWNGNGQ